MVVGRVESLWRYPVKSMAGEELNEAFLAIGGVRGDRLYAFHSSRARPEFPYLTAREQPAMLLHRARCSNSSKLGDETVIVAAPSGEQFVIDDPRLIARLNRNAREGELISLLRSERAMADCYPISLFSVQTAQQLSEELSKDIDKRRFRANIYADLVSQAGFKENEFVGHKLQIGATAIVKIIERDERCKMITLDPGTAEADPNVMRLVAREHNGTAGVYGAVLVEGAVQRGDAIMLLP